MKTPFPFPGVTPVRALTGLSLWFAWMKKRPCFGTTVLGALRVLDLLLIAGLFTALPVRAADGDVDPTFDRYPNGLVNTVAVQADTGIIMGGRFTTVDRMPWPFLMMFGGHMGLCVPYVDSPVSSVAVQADGKILLAGWFTNAEFAVRNHIARLNPNCSLDSDFDPNPNGGVYHMAIQADGKILIGGSFTTVGGTACTNIARLNADGTLDTGFALSVAGFISCLAVQADAKILLGGSFTNVGWGLHTNIARVDASGSLDPDFNPSANGSVYNIAVQADGKILLGGYFTTVCGTARTNIARLNADGTLDPNFNPGANGSAVSIALQADGKILLGGGFSLVGGTLRKAIARLNADGTLDPGFDPNANSSVNCLAVQANGKILLGGWFTTVGETPRNYIARLLNGPAMQTLTVPDTTRVQWLRGGTAPEVEQVTFELSNDGGSTWAPLGRGARITGGWALTGLSLPLSGSIRAHGRATDGNGSSLIEQVTSYALPDIGVLVDGTNLMTGASTVSFGTYHLGQTSPFLTFTITNAGVSVLTIGAVKVEGSLAGDYLLDTNGLTTRLSPGATTTFRVAFHPTADGLRNVYLRITNNDDDESPFEIILSGLSTSADPDFDPDANNSVYGLATQTDGKTLLGGGFSRVGGTIRNRIARLNPDGTLDPEFDPNANNSVIGIAVQSDGGIVLAGLFTTVGETTRNRIARVNANGTLDPAFNPNANGPVRAMAVQADGKIVLGGTFTTMGGASRMYMARINANGTLDTDFDADISYLYGGEVSSLAVQPDGKILLGGHFTWVGDTRCTNIARLNANGTLDLSFQGTSASVPDCIAVQPDGKILLGTRRLNADGTPDPCFSLNLDDRPQSVALLADGKILLGGFFTSVDAIPRGYVARVHSDSSLDHDFNPNANNILNGVAVEADGRILLGGSFTTVGGMARNRIARLLNEPASQALTIPDNGQVQWLRNGTTPEVEQVTFELSTDGGSTWILLGRGSHIPGGWAATGLSLPVGGLIRAQGRATGGQYNSSSSLIEQMASFNNLISTDIGRPGIDYDPGLPTSTTKVGHNGYDVVATGTDIWGQNDGFRYVHEQRTGDFDALVQVTQLVYSAYSAKAGLMIRESLAPDSRYCMCLVKPAAGANNYGMEMRTATGVDSIQVATSDGVPYPNAWLRLRRVGNLISAFRSSDGQSWALIGQVTLGFTDPVYLGMATTSHDFTNTTTASYRNYHVTADPAPAAYVVAQDSVAMEDNGVPAGFMVHLLEPWESDVTVDYSLSGTASNGTDYQPLGGSVTVPAGSEGASVMVQPVDDGLAEGPETILLNLGPPVEDVTGHSHTGTPQPYEVLAAASAATTILDDEITPSGLVREIYCGIPGSAISDLTSSPKFPGMPSVVDVVPALEGTYLSNTAGDNYGQRFWGWLIPPETGSYIFYLASDDAAQLFLSTDETTTYKQLIVEEAGWNEYRNWEGQYATEPIINPVTGEPFLQRASTSIPLVAGRYYYIEVLHKEGLGGDHLGVTWKLPSGPTPLNGSASILGTNMVCRLPFRAGAPVTLANPSFELDTFSIWPGYIGPNGLITGWTGGGGINPVWPSGDAPFADNGTTPDGRQVGFIQSDGALSQTVSGLVPGAVYQLRYRENARLWNSMDGTNLPLLEVRMGSQTIVPRHRVSPVEFDRPYHSVTSVLFVADAPAMELAFLKSSSPPLDNTVLLDDVRIIVPGTILPITVTLPATEVTANSATLHGTVNPQYSATAAWFEWGTSLDYGNATVPISVGYGDAEVPLTALLENLVQDVTYHFRLVSTNRAGIAYGSDQTFTFLQGGNPNDGFATDANGAVWCVAVQADGKILAGGDFSTILNVPRSRIARINPDGSLDTAFDPGTDNRVYCLAVQPDGKILLGGDFTEVHGTPRGGIARLNPDGTLDTSFNPGANGSVRSLALRADGKILVGGAFTVIAEVNRTGLAQLHADGALDTSFAAQCDDLILALAVQADGRILAGGRFTRLGGQACANLGRLNADGTLDTGFNPGPDNIVRTLALHLDGKILAGGDFTLLAGQPRSYLGRLNPEGSLDTAFTAGVDHNQLRSLLVQPNGKILVGGAFTYLTDLACNRIGRLNPDGTMDTSFNVGSGADNMVYCLALQSDGKIVVGGTFATLADRPCRNLGRLNPDGSAEQTFNPGADTAVLGLTVQPDGKILVGGDFLTLAGQARTNLGRLNPDGSLDTAFASMANGNVRSLLVQTNGRIVVGGFFDQLSGQPRVNLGRLHPNGLLDTSFIPTITEGYNSVFSLADYPFGKVLVGGAFAMLDGTPRSGLALLDARGWLNLDFNPALTGFILSVAVQPDHMILIGGEFTSVGGEPHTNIARLHLNGAVDSTFRASASSSAPYPGVYSIVVQPDGKILLGGGFTNMCGQQRDYIGRLNPDGTLDESFNPGADWSVLGLALQTDGKILAGGYFTNLAGHSCPRLGRLHPDGTLDPSFDTRVEGDFVGPVLIQTDGKVLIGGVFSAVNEQPRQNLARLTSGQAALQNLTLSPDAHTLTWERSGTSPEIERMIFERSADGTNYTVMGIGWRIPGGWQRTGVSLPRGQNFIRARGRIAGGYCNGALGLVESVRPFYVYPPQIVAHPESQTVTAGELVSFSVTADGLNPMSYQWWKDGVALVNGPDCNGAQSATLNLPHTQPGDAGLYGVVVRNAHGEATSAWAALMVQASLDVIPLTEAWRYDQSGLDLGSTWKEPGYDDSTWPSGLALLYAETAPLPGPKSTPLNLGPITYYFRTHFNLPPNAAVSNLVASALVDDGAVIYLNGVESGRIGMPVGPIAYATLSERTVSDVTGYDVLTLPAGSLAAGDNLVAVEVHQSSSNSTDAVFGLSLNASLLFTDGVAPDAAPAILLQPASQRVELGSNVTLFVWASGAPVLSYQWRFNNSDLAGSASSRLTLSHARLQDAGNYSVVVANPYGSVTSQVAALNVLNPALRFSLLSPTNVWKFNQAGQSLGTAWKETGFNDSAWPSGPGLFGVEPTLPYPYPEPIRTALSLVPAGGNSQVITYYFRTHFQYAGNPEGVSVVASNHLDDGAVFYLNGGEAGRVRMPTGPVSYSTLAQNVNPEGLVDVVYFPPGLLVMGDNVVAVEVHQTTTNSTDVVFGVSLGAAVTNNNQTLHIPSVQAGFGPGGRVQMEVRGPYGAAYIIEASDDLIRWDPIATNFVPAGVFPYEDPAAPHHARRFYRAVLAP